MLFKTEGIVLRVVHYGETSVIVSIFTELFGIQTYLVNGVRSARSKSARANILQPANILELVVYHREQKNLQRLSSFKPSYIYHGLYSNVVKNAIALYVVELLYKSLTEPENNPELFEFAKKSLIWMDRQQTKKLSNFHLYFTIKLAGLLGFEMGGHYNSQTCYFDLKEGEFVSQKGIQFCLEEEESKYTDELLRIIDMENLPDIKMSPDIRSSLLSAYLNFFKLHIQGFRDLNSPKILKEILH